MNKKQKQVLVAVICVVVAMLLFPPFHFINSKGIKLNKGYAFLFSPPTLSSGIQCSVDVGMLLTQCLVVLIIGAIAFFLTKGSSVTPKSSPQQSTVVTPHIEKPEEDKRGKFWGGIHHPWRRYFARIVDISALGLPTLFVVAYAVGFFFPDKAYGFVEAIRNLIIGGFIILTLLIPIEAVLLSTVGNTPAKWLFGISVRTTLGHKPSLTQALERSFRVVFQGMGLGIPFVAFFTVFFAYQRLTKTGTTLWDTATECVVTHKTWGTARTIVCVTTVLLSILLSSIGKEEMDTYNQRGDAAAVKSEMEEKLPDNLIDYRENENKTESKSALPDNFIDPWDRYSKLDVDKKSDPLNGQYDKKTADNPNRISDKEPKNESILIKEHYESIKRAHPDFEKYRDNGSLKAWIQKQPRDLSNLLMKTYNDGDSDSVIALLNQFKKDKNNPIFKAPAPYLNSPKKSPDPPKAEELTPARAPAMAGSFITYDNGIILDESTNLMWAAKDNGVNINWQDAKNYCNNYREGGYTDWRMPTQDELAGLCDVSKFQKTECGGSPNHIATDLIHVTCWQVWASEMRDGSAATWKMTEVAYFNFDNCYQSWGMWTNASYRRALPVRSGKKDNNIPIVKVPVPAPSNRGRDSGGSVTYMTKNRIRTPYIGNPSLYPYLPPPVDADQRYREIKAIELKNGKIIEGQILSLNTSTVKIRTTEGKVISYSFEREVQRLIKE